MRLRARKSTKEPMTIEIEDSEKGIEFFGLITLPKEKAVNASLDKTSDYTPMSKDEVEQKSNEENQYNEEQDEEQRNLEFEQEEVEDKEEEVAREKEQEVLEEKEEEKENEQKNDKGEEQKILRDKKVSQTRKFLKEKRKLKKNGYS